MGQPRWSSTTATSSRSAPSRSIVRTKLCPVGPKSHELRTTQASLARRCLAVELRPCRTPRAGSGCRIRRTARPCARRRRSRTRTRRAAPRALPRAPCRRRSPRPHPAGRPRRRRRSSTRPRAGRAPAGQIEAGAGNRTSQSARVERAAPRPRRRPATSAAAELAARARDQDATALVPRRRGSVSGVLHRSFTRGSFQGMPCSSGSAGSYSSVTW